MDTEQSELDKLIEYRKALMAPKAENKTALESILEYLADASGSIVLSDANEKIFTRLKEIQKMKLDGKANSQIINYFTKFYGVSESTVRNDLRNLGRVFPNNLDVDVEMQVLYERTQMLASRLSKSSNPKMLNLLTKVLQTQRDILLYFKGDNNLPNPEDFKPNVFVVTVNPEDIGITDDVPSIEELKEKYKSKSQIADLGDIEDIEHEEV